MLLEETSRSDPTDRTPHSRVQLRVACRKEMNGGNPALPGNDEISPSVSWRLTRAARYPLDPPGIAQFLRRGNWPISKVRVCSLDRARDAIDLVAATIDALGLVEHAIFGEDLVDGRAPTRGVVFTEDVVKIAGQQGRYAIGHGLSPLGIEWLAISRPGTALLARRGSASPHGDYVSKSVPSTAGHRFSKSRFRWSPRSNRAWIRCCASGHVSAV